MIPTMEWFNERVVKSDGCWLSTGVPNANGYVAVQYGSRAESKKWLLHRLSYTLHKGTIPDGMVMNHLCENRGCCNPDHLELTTHSGNQKYRFRNHIVLPYSICETCGEKKRRTYPPYDKTYQSKCRCDKRKVNARNAQYRANGCRHRNPCPHH